MDQCDIVRLIWQLRKFSQVGGGSESMVRPTFAPVVIVRDTGNHDDELSSHALFFVVDAINRYPDANIFYSDEDKLDLDGTRVEPYFKPDWNPELFL